MTEKRIMKWVILCITIKHIQHNQIKMSKSLTLFLSGQNGSNRSLDYAPLQGVYNFNLLKVICS